MRVRWRASVVDVREVEVRELVWSDAVREVVSPLGVAPPRRASDGRSTTGPMKSRRGWQRGGGADARRRARPLLGLRVRVALRAASGPRSTRAFGSGRLVSRVVELGDVSWVLVFGRSTAAGSTTGVRCSGLDDSGFDDSGCRLTPGPRSPGRTSPTSPEPTCPRRTTPTRRSRWTPSRSTGRRWRSGRRRWWSVPAPPAPAPLPALPAAGGVAWFAGGGPSARTPRADRCRRAGHRRRDRRRERALGRRDGASAAEPVDARVGQAAEEVRGSTSGATAASTMSFAAGGPPEARRIRRSRWWSRSSWARPSSALDGRQAVADGRDGAGRLGPVSLFKRRARRSPARRSPGRRRAIDRARSA